MADETSQTKEEIDKQEYVGIFPIDFNSDSLVQKFEDVNLFEKEQSMVVSLPGSPPLLHWMG